MTRGSPGSILLVFLESISKSGATQLDIIGFATFQKYSSNLACIGNPQNFQASFTIEKYHLSNSAWVMDHVLMAANNHLISISFPFSKLLSETTSSFLAWNSASIHLSNSASISDLLSTFSQFMLFQADWLRENLSCNSACSISCESLMISSFFERAFLFLLKSFKRGKTWLLKTFSIWVFELLSNLQSYFWVNSLSNHWDLRNSHILASTFCSFAFAKLNIMSSFLIQLSLVKSSISFPISDAIFVFLFLCICA